MIINLLVVLLANIVKIYTVQGAEFSTTVKPEDENGSSSKKDYSKNVFVAEPMIWIWLSCGIIGIIIIVIIIIYKYKASKKKDGDLNNIVVEDEVLNGNVLQSTSTKPEKSLLIENENSEELTSNDVSNEVTSAKIIIVENEESKQKLSQDIPSKDIVEETLLLRNTDSKANSPHNLSDRSSLQEALFKERRTSRKSSRLSVLNEDITEETSLLKTEENPVKEKKSSRNCLQKHISAVVSSEKISDLGDNELLEHIPSKTATIVILEEKSILGDEKTTQNILNETILEKRLPNVDDQEQHGNLPITYVNNETYSQTATKDGLSDTKSSVVVIKEINPTPIPIYKNPEIEKQFVSLDPEARKTHLQLLNKSVLKFKPKSVYLEIDSTMEHEELKNKTNEDASNKVSLESNNSITVNPTTECESVGSSIAKIPAEEHAKAHQVASLDPETKKIHMQLLTKSIQKYKEKSISIDDKSLIENSDKLNAESLLNVQKETYSENDVILEDNKIEEDMQQKNICTSLSEAIPVLEDGIPKIKSSQKDSKIDSIEKALCDPTQENTEPTGTETSTKIKRFSLLNPRNMKLNLQVLAKNFIKQRKSSDVGKLEESRNSSLKIEQPIKNVKLTEKSQIIDSSEKKNIVKDESKGESSQNVFDNPKTEEISNSTDNLTTFDDNISPKELNTKPLSKRLSKIAGIQFGSLDPVTKKLHLQLLANSVQKFKRRLSQEEDTLVVKRRTSNDNLQNQTTRSSKKEVDPEESIILENDCLKNELCDIITPAKIIQNSTSLGEISKQSKEILLPVCNTDILRIKSVLENDHQKKESIENVSDKEGSKEIPNDSNGTKIEQMSAKISVKELISEPTPNSNSENKEKETQFALLDPSMIKLHLQLLNKSIQKFKRKSSFGEELNETSVEGNIQNKIKEVAPITVPKTLILDDNIVDDIKKSEKNHFQHKKTDSFEKTQVPDITSSNETLIVKPGKSDSDSKVSNTVTVEETLCIDNDNKDLINNSDSVEESP